MPREGGASSIRRLLSSCIAAFGILDRPPSQTMTAESCLTLESTRNDDIENAGPRYAFTSSLRWNAERIAPSASIAADMFSANDRLPTASVIAPTTIGPMVWPIPNEIVSAAIAVGQDEGG